MEVVGVKTVEKEVVGGEARGREGASRGRGGEAHPVPKEYGGFLLKNLTPLLGYWEIRDGMVFLEDGSVEFGLEVYPQPDAYLSVEDKERLGEAMESLIALLPEGARLRYYYEAQKGSLDAVRRYLSLKKNPDPVARRMVWERAKGQLKAALEGGRLRWTVKLLVHVPPMVTPATGNLLRDIWLRAKQLLGYGVKAHPFTPFYESEYAAVVSAVENLRRAVYSQVASAGYSVEVMGDDDIYTMLYRWLNLDPQTRLRYQPLNEFYTPEEVRKRKLDPPTLRRQVCQTPLWATAMDILYKKPFGTPPGWEEEHLAIYELAAPPAKGYWGALAEVITEATAVQPAPMAVVVDVYKPPQNELKLSLSRAFVRKYRESRSGEAPEASSLTQEGLLLNALTRAEEGEMFVRFSLSVVVKADTAQELASRVKYFDGVLAGPPFGGAFRRLKENLFYPYLNLLPFSGRRQAMSFLVMSKGVSRFLSNPGPWNREGEGAKPMVLLSDRYAGIVPLDLFEKRARSWNVVMVGTTGGGKTFTAQYLLSEALAEDPDTELIIVDKKGDYAPWVSLMGGNVIDIAPGSGVTVNMFDLDQTFYRERPALPPERKLAFLQGMFHILLGKPNDPHIALKQQLWLEAVRVAYGAGTDVEYDGQGREVGYSVRVPILGQVIDTIRNLDAVGGNSLTAEQKVVARELATELSSWLMGPMASFLNGPTNLKGDNARIVYFNLAGVGSLNVDIYMTLALALISERIYGRLERAPRNVKKFIVFDEAHALFKVKEAADMVVDLYRRARSYGASVWTLTQTIREYRGPNAQGIIETTNIFLFVNSKGQAEDIHEVLKVPLPVGQTAANLQQVKGLFNEMLYILYDQSGGIQGDVLRIYPTPWDYWLFTSHHEEVARRNALVGEMGGDMYKAIAKLAKLDTQSDYWVERLMEGAEVGELQRLYREKK